MASEAYMVVIASFDPERKIRAIMRIREVTGLGIADAKSLLDNVPSTLMDGMYLEQAVQLSDLLKEMGIGAEIKMR
ncbi:MAG: ribosomal protein L7/L12 [Candidatus Moduliflexus flocculans]|nr:ribosomal protein L7/L12 [Candidatus Moduliflexus flocculans]